MTLSYFKEALASELFTNRSQEVCIRPGIWRRYNERTRAGEPLYQQNDDRHYYQSNLVRLEALLCEKVELPEDEEEDPDEEGEKILLRAEG